MIGFLLFSIRRAWQGFWRNAVMSLAATVTMTLMLMMLAGLVIGLSGMDAGLRFVEQKVEVQAFVADGTPQARVDALVAQVRALPEVADVQYIDKTQALEQWQAQLRQQGKPDYSSDTGTNPIPASILVKLKDPHVYGSVIQTLQSAQGVVTDVLETRHVVDALLTVTGFLRTAGVVVLVLVGVTVLFIVVNTIRLAVVARAEEIEIMRLVGASDAFIRWPFIFEGMLVGLFGAAITLGILALAAQPIGQAVATVVGQVPIQFDQNLGEQLVAVVGVAGLGLGAAGAFISVRTYLIR
ncbi:MAG: permease-like cell division protein FtsX [Chloroflexi bacterium]|nr:permease-like cell division protein FtsX [Chloroflexota bacterium]